jgi:hypothetical protein
VPFPTSAFEIVAIIVLLLPGLVFAVVRRTLRGFQYDDLAIDSRIAQALVISVLLDAVYLVTSAPLIAGMVDLSQDPPRILDPVGLGLTVLVACVGIPGALAALIYMPFRPRFRLEGETGFVIRGRRTIRADSVPTAWDKAASVPDNRLVRVQRPGIGWIGGLYAENSYVSTYPQPRDIYISVQMEVSPEGVFGEAVADTDGVWLRINDDDIVEFVKPVYTPDELEALAAARAHRPKRPIWLKKLKE